MPNGQIIEGRGGLYTIRDEQGTCHVVRAKKKFRHDRITPMVGDRVVFTPGVKDEHGWLEEILPRVSSLIRPPCANITLMLIVLSPSPAPDWLLIDKLILTAHSQNMRVALIVNKSDLDPDLYDVVLSDYRGADVTVLRACAEKREGIEAVRELLHGETVCLAGQSGVGKSTMINGLMSLSLETGDISKIERGRHTTRHVQLIDSGDIHIMDTPGFSLLEAEEAQDPVLLQDNYPEFTPFLGGCRFQPCYHDSEPGCAVKTAAAEGRISAARYSRYRELLAREREMWKERYD